jgi:hypothetical protein
MHSNRAPTSATTAEHYAWGAGCDGWHLVRAPALSVIQERMPPGAAEVRHRHAVAQVATLRVFPPALKADGAGRRRISRLAVLVNPLSCPGVLPPPSRRGRRSLPIRPGPRQFAADRTTPSTLANTRSGQMTTITYVANLA